MFGCVIFKISITLIKGPDQTIYSVLNIYKLVIDDYRILDKLNIKVHSGKTNLLISSVQYWTSLSYFIYQLHILTDILWNTDYYVLKQAGTQ